MKLFLAALALFVGTMPAAAQWMDYPWPDIPRTADGTPDLTAPAPRGSDGRPDLSGVWDGPRPVTRLDPASLQPWVTELVRQRQQEYYRTRPLYQCQPSGPEAERFGSWKRILQTPTAIAILNDDLTYRVIHTDGRELEADPFPTWAGYSVGRWDGDTLVVESNGFNDKTWVSRYGISHTEALRITERYRRADFGHLQVEVTYTDPGAFTQPWGFTLDMELMADSDMLESVCERGSEDWAGSLSDAAGRAVSVPPEVLARYVGVYTGIYAGSERTYEVSLSGGQLFATIVGDYASVGLGAAGLGEGATRLLVPQSETAFEGLGLGYRFIVDDQGVVTDLMVVHVSGDYRYSRQR
ncbi:MAG: hypothetical protein OXF98_09750 [Rhodospirillaceae bacterium]|nr:hypothetical protein [Rhodospirillaceae bacterium]